jgi:transcriptional regulator with XRE-family HTH domain
MDKEAGARISLLIKEKGYSRRTFSEFMGVSPATLNNWISRGASNDTLMQVANKFPDISLSWLLRGDGDMLNNNKSVIVDSNHTGVPFYDVDFALGFMEYYENREYPQAYIHIPGYEKATCWCRTSGNSMYPEIASGDIICLREIEDWNTWLAFNEVYAIVAKNGLRTVKIIRKGSSDDTFTLHSVNPEYEDQEIPKVAILKIFAVLGTISKL